VANKRLLFKNLSTCKAFKPDPKSSKRGILLTESTEIFQPQVLTSHESRTICLVRFPEDNDLVNVEHGQRTANLTGQVCPQLCRLGVVYYGAWQRNRDRV
jgi:hypothetical protein